MTAATRSQRRLLAVFLALGVIWLAVLLAVVGGLVWPSSSHAATQTFQIPAWCAKYPARIAPHHATGADVIRSQDCANYRWAARREAWRQKELKGN